MTELQIGLISLGAAAVVGVLAYNKWQEHKHRKIAEQLLNSRHNDVLLSEPAPADAFDAPLQHAGDAGDAEKVDALNALPEVDDLPVAPHSPPVESQQVAERLEPSLRADPQREEPTMAADTLLVEPEIESRDSRPVSSTPLPVVPVTRTGDESKESKEAKDCAPPLHLLSPVIDYIAAFEAIEPAPAYQILESQRDVLARVRKPVHWIGYNERTREWEPIIDAENGEYRRIRAGLQLVDRHGPARDNDLSVFHIAMQDLADELMAVADLPPRQPALEAAAQLDQFCAGVDIQIGINVISQGQTFAGTKLRALAEAAGMALDADGRFVRLDDEGQVLYVLTNHEAPGFSAESMKSMSTHGVTFLLDVPRVAHGDRVFNQMLDLARRFAEALHGALVDDNRRPLSEGALEPIRRQVAQYQSVMATRNLPAGGPLALRLFS